MLAQLTIILGGTDVKAMSTFSLQLLLEEMEIVTQRYELLEKLRQRQSLPYPSGNEIGYSLDASASWRTNGEHYPSGNRNAGWGKGFPKLTPTLWSFATATLSLVCARWQCCYSFRHH
jgi:hypothetical protein